MLHKYAHLLLSNNCSFLWLVHCIKLSNVAIWIILLLIPHASLCAPYVGMEDRRRHFEIWLMLLTKRKLMERIDQMLKRSVFYYSWLRMRHGDGPWSEKCERGSILIPKAWDAAATISAAAEKPWPLTDIYFTLSAGLNLWHYFTSVA